MACVSSVCTRFGAQSTTASISFFNVSRPTRSSVSLKPVAAAAASNSSGLLHCSFVSSSSLAFASSSSSTFAGSSLGLDFSSRSAIELQTRRSLVVRSAKKYQLAQTKRNRSRKSLARTHGFRLRMRTTSGRATIKRRRAKGRWTLCTKSNPSSGKRA
ncbi:large ribosomal subunit protein bL34c [Rutidosis leptorrhynchoides]|uniref:large ribosomal subunit protein bL34c n=1 Tax=Rutidosis leptorrhynchoides TaxID=125765 RepID=UPI003A9953B1